MAIKDLRKILKQVHEPNEFQLVAHDMNHPYYWIWKLENAKMKDLNSYLRPLRKEHARFDIFINGQYILERDYIFEQVNNDLHIKFKRSNFAFNLESSDDIKLEGDITAV
jgi:hypothetical protein